MRRTYMNSRSRWIIGGCAAVVIVGIAVFFLMGAMGAREPRLNDNTIVLSKFVANSSGFAALPWEKQRQYYKVLDDRDKEIDRAFESTQLTESEYRAAIEAAWLGKHINR